MNSIEKDVDNPSANHDRPSSVETRDASTPSTLTQLFAAPEATPILSRHASYTRTPSGTAYTRSSNGDSTSLPSHLYTRGLLSGRHSDINIHAFNTTYPLHRILLDRAPFFTSALSEPWFESSAREMTLHPEEVDSNITQASFELALKRLYGCPIPAEEDREAIGLFATGCWLEMADLIEASVNSILRQLSTAKLGSLIKLVTASYYGKHGDRILASTKAMLCREGWEMPLRYWDSVTGEVAREVIGGDGFFVPGEWERFVLARKILDRKLKAQGAELGLLQPSGKPKCIPLNPASFSSIRFDFVRGRNSFATQVPESWEPWVTLYTSPDVAPFMMLLDEGIHFVHLNFEQLQRIREYTDFFGLSLVPEKTINDALWMQMELRQKIINAPELDLELGLSRPAHDEVLEVSEKESKKRSPNRKGKEKDSGFVTLEVEGENWEDEQHTGRKEDPRPRKFWIPNVDSTSIVGGNPEAALYPVSNDNRPFVSRSSASSDPIDVQWASDFTASAGDRPATSGRSDPRPPLSYTNYPPFRFAAEFPNPRSLKEKKRVYSRTVWYAGSLWNLYIQKVETTKNTQLGVYLHRAKDKEGQEENFQHHTGSVDERIGQVELLLRRNLNRRHSRPDGTDDDENLTGNYNNTSGDTSTVASPEPQSRTATITNLLRGNTLTSPEVPPSLTKSSQIPGTPGASALLHQTYHLPLHTTQTGNSDSENEDASFHSGMRDFSKTQNCSVPTIPPYVDGRPTIKTYFKIYSPSKGGRMLSVYESAPDLFNFSQSWGWKSSTMVLDDGLAGYERRTSDLGTGASAALNRGARDARLRFMVVIGNV